MRDLKRIDDFCSRLATCWKTVPDWRFMQLICNFQRACERDMFYSEDDRTIELLETYLPPRGNADGDC